MRTTHYIIAMSSALCLGALAEEHNQKQQQTPQKRNQQSVFKPGSIPEEKLKQTVTAINKASTFMGMPVKNLQNQDLGKVQDLVFDPKEGKIAYVVLATGGFLGVAEKSVAIPLKSLQAMEGADHLVLNMTKEQLNSAPGLAANNWPPLNTFAVGSAAGSESGTQSQQQSYSTSPSDTQPDQQSSTSIGSNSDASNAGAPATSESSKQESATEPPDSKPDAEAEIEIDTQEPKEK